MGAGREHLIAPYMIIVIMTVDDDVRLSPEQLLGYMQKIQRCLGREEGVKDYNLSTEVNNACVADRCTAIFRDRGERAFG